MHVPFTITGRARQRWRAVLLVLAAAILALPIALAVDGARAAGPDRLPLTLSNDTGRDEPVYLYVMPPTRAVRSSTSPWRSSRSASAAGSSIAIVRAERADGQSRASSAASSSDGSTRVR
jgi:hypothetical protein